MSPHLLYKNVALYFAIFVLCCTATCIPAPAGEEMVPSPAPLAPVAPENRLPVIQSLTASAKVMVNSDTTVTCKADDPDGDRLVFIWSATGGTIEGQGSTATWSAPEVPGIFTVNVTVKDEHGGEVTDSVKVAVTDTPNRPPVIESFDILVHEPHAELTIDPATPIIERQNPVVKVSRLVDIECNAVDPDKDKLEYEWDIPAGKVIGHGEKIQWLASTEPQRYIIIVTITDGNGGQATAKLAIDVKCCI
jgi:hypothetical protein